MTTALQLIQDPTLANEDSADLRTTELLSLHEYAESLMIDPDDLMVVYPARLWQQRRARFLVNAATYKTQELLRALKKS